MWKYSSKYPEMYLEPVNNVRIYIYRWPFRAHSYDRPAAVDKWLLTNIFAQLTKSLDTPLPYHLKLQQRKQKKNKICLFFSIIKIFCAKARLQFVERLRFIRKGNYDLVEWLHRLTIIGRNILWQSNVYSFCGMKSTIYNKKWITIFQ